MNRGMRRQKGKEELGPHNQRGGGGERKRAETKVLRGEGEGVGVGANEVGRARRTKGGKSVG